jgi:hypothetical protein
VVGDIRVEAEILKMLGDDRGLEVTIAQTFTRSLVIVKFLNELGESEVYEGFAGDLRVELGKEAAPFSADLLAYLLLCVRA